MNQSSPSRWEHYLVPSDGSHRNLWIDAPGRCNLLFPSRSPGPHRLLLPCVRSPPLPYLPGPEHLLLSNLQPVRVLPTVNLRPVKCNQLTQCPFEFVGHDNPISGCSNLPEWFLPHSITKTPSHLSPTTTFLISLHAWLHDRLLENKTYTSLFPRL